MEDNSDEDSHDLDNTSNFRRSKRQNVLPSGTNIQFISSKSENEESSLVVNEIHSPLDHRSNIIASTSNEDRPPPGSNSPNGQIHMNSTSENNDITERVSPAAFEDHLAIENEIPERGTTDLVSVGDTSEETIPSLLGFLDTEREQERIDGVVRHDDESSNSTGNLSAEMRTRETRFDGRGSIWDAVLRQNGGRHGDSQAFAFSSDDSDDLGSRERLLRDFGDGSIGGGATGDRRYSRSRTRNISLWRQRASSEIWESIRRGSDAYHRRIGRCPSGLHAYGTCPCEDAPTALDAGPRASISRIIMLAETLFEVLDEIQRQPVPLSLPAGLLPAPEVVVDSLPVKSHVIKHESENDVEQCYICLAEYEEGDEIRVLPCYHEYHKSCVDKWLKEVHRVCPLCRGDVCGEEAPVSNREIPLA